MMDFQTQEAIHAMCPGVSIAGDIATRADGTPLTQADIDAAFAQYGNVRGARLVRAEAERRIAAGLVLSSGVRFRCDETSLNRIDAMARSAIWPKTFKTAGGVTVTLNSKSEIEAIFDECDRYVTDVLATSATLQDNPPSEPCDDTHWPDDGA